MEGDVSPVRDRLDTVRKTPNGARVFPENDDQDQINTRRETKPETFMNKIFGFNRSKTHCELENKPEDKLSNELKIRKGFSFNEQEGSENKNVKIDEDLQTLKEKSTDFREQRDNLRKTNIFSRFTKILRKTSTFSLNVLKRGITKAVETEMDKIRGHNVVNVANEDLVENEDWDLDFGHVHIKFPFLIINPFGRFKKIWNIISFFLLVVILIVYPVRLCFELDFDDNFSWAASWLPFDCVIDFICLMDIVVNFLFAYEDETGMLITSREKIARSYLKKSFATDLFGLFPVNPLVIQFKGVQYGVRGFNHETYIAWRIIRLVKLIKCLKLFNQMEVCLQMLKRRLEFTSLLKFGLEILLFVHLTACFWNLLGEVELLDSWLDVENNRYDPIFSKYMECIYFSLAVLLTVGYGNISGNNTTERSFLIVWTFLGVIVYAYIIGSLSIIFAKLNESKTSKNERELFYTNFAKIFKLPFKILDQVLVTIGMQYLNTNTAWVKVYETNKLLTELPKSLYGDICTYVYRELIEKIDFFQHKPKHFLVRILPLLKPNNLAYGDEVYKNGDPSNEVFFIHKGRIASICHDRFGRIRSQIFVQGAYFGECDIIYKRARASTAFAESDVALWKLNKAEFIAILEEFPQVKKEVLVLSRIKEMYRAPIVNAVESKVKDYMYAKKILSKARTKRYDENLVETQSPMLPKSKNDLKNTDLSEINTPLTLSRVSSIFSPDLPKKSLKGKSTQGPHAGRPMDLRKFALQPKMTAATRQLALAAGKNIDTQEELASPVVVRNVESISKENSDHLVKAFETPTGLRSPKFHAEEEKSSRMFEELVEEDTNAKLGGPSSEQKEAVNISNSFTYNIQEMQTTPNRKEKLRTELIDYLKKKGYSIENYEAVEMLIKGKDSVMDYKTELESISNKTIEEIDNYTDTEARLASSFERYSLFLTHLTNSLKKRE